MTVTGYKETFVSDSQSDFFFLTNCLKDLTLVKEHIMRVHWDPTKGLVSEARISLIYLLSLYIQPKKITKSNGISCAGEKLTY